MLDFESILRRLSAKSRRAKRLLTGKLEICGTRRCPGLFGSVYPTVHTGGRLRISRPLLKTLLRSCYASFQFRV
jgi:hypothetical protein